MKKVKQHMGNERNERNEGNKRNERKRKFREAESRQESKLDPYEIEFLPEFRQGRGPEVAFINEYGVVIGDHMYESEHSPLQQWDENTDPSIMSGDQWVHPFKDIGFWSEENRDYFEKGIPPQGGMFTHPSIDVAYEANMENVDGKPEHEE